MDELHNSTLLHSSFHIFGAFIHKLVDVVVVLLNLILKLTLFFPSVMLMKIVHFFEVNNCVTIACGVISLYILRKYSGGHLGLWSFHQWDSWGSPQNTRINAIFLTKSYWFKLHVLPFHSLYNVFTWTVSVKAAQSELNESAEGRHERRTSVRPEG